MQRICLVVLVLLMILHTAACAENIAEDEIEKDGTAIEIVGAQKYEASESKENGVAEVIDMQGNKNETGQKSEQASAFDPAPAPDPIPEPQPDPEPDDKSAVLEIVIGDKTYTALLAETEAARQFAENLPMTVDMSELNGNEKYYYMDSNLTAASVRPGTIETGDLMLYGNNCLVLFYETFSSSYSYTRLGKLEDPSGLAEAVGSGNVTVTFRITE